MIPDPNTLDGMKEIERRVKKRRKEAIDIRKRAKENTDEEPSGKLTAPSEFDLFRDWNLGL